MANATESHEQEGLNKKSKEKELGLTGYVGSPIINEIVFKAIRVYTTCIPHPVPSPCYNALGVNESVTNLTSCVGELEFLKEQCVAILKPHSVLVTYDLLQCGLLSEDAILSLHDDEGNNLVPELPSDEEEEDEDEDAEETEEMESQGETANKDLDLTSTYDKIKLALSKMLVDMVYKEASTTVKKAFTREKFMWLDRIKTALDLNSVTDVQAWLDKLIDCVKNLENYVLPQTSKWMGPNESTLNDPREIRLTTQEIWSEIDTTLMDNLEINEGLLNELKNHNIINQHTELRICCLPNRKAKVKSLLSYLNDMGSSVMFTFGNILMMTDQKSLGRIVIKRLNDNNISFTPLDF